MYHLADQSWRRRPHFMSEATVVSFARRLAEYATTLKLERVSVLLHGGEPLLAGPERFRAFIEKIRTAMTVVPTCNVEFAMQTNGTLLDQEWLELLAELEVSFGISLDGDRTANDRFRLDHNGRSTFDRVRAAIGLIHNSKEGQHLFKGLLSVIDLRNDPVITFNALRELNPPRLDFLFPDANYEAPPFIPSSELDGPYGDWLIRIFDAWWENPGSTRLRLFENILDLLLGGHSQTEGIGEGVLNLVTIETDGEIEDVDILKAAFSGAASLGTPAPNVSTHSFAEVSHSTAVKKRHLLLSHEGLCKTCQDCPIGKVCGGGMVSHRFSRELGFDNPSFYCRDLFRLITHIAKCVGKSLEPLVADGFVRRASGFLRRPQI